MRIDASDDSRTKFTVTELPETVSDELLRQLSLKMQCIFACPLTVTKTVSEERDTLTIQLLGGCTLPRSERPMVVHNVLVRFYKGRGAEDSLLCLHYEIDGRSYRRTPDGTVEALYHPGLLNAHAVSA